MPEDKEPFDCKYILWVYSDGGYHPYGFDTLKEAIEYETYSSCKIITKRVEYIVIDQT